MARNVEIKARIDGDVDALTRKAAALASSGPFEIAQDDTFFHCSSGGSSCAPTRTPKAS